VAIERVDAHTVTNPLLISRGLQSLLGVPLLVGDRVLGVLHVGSLSARRFSEDETRLLQLIADRVALAVQARLFEADRTAARVLQRSLLPAGLPTVPGLELAARYVPGDEGEVGGDWYDVFALPSGSLCLVVGDVAGHGLEAAHAMGRARTALRAYALEWEQPAELLTKLDRHTSHFHPGLMITVLCAVIEPSLESVAVSVAGHPPPVLAIAGQDSARLLDLPVDLPVGLPRAVMQRAPDRRTTTIELPAGAVLCAYTDGLVERRRLPLDHGLAQLAHAVHSGPAEAVCAKIMAELVGAASLEDDAALLVLHRPPR
jgi:serine phosphatase RsbU (regulator of sigma subunit)